ncbi:hypothetical protein SAV31267_059700 [Streptomyces avermitilis]|uniref:Uncharacterized protein n=1 Tax=Streptomyces avermitilis TaxID=33903 RepID=A0A4D4MYG7_STRAX|nr:hypothetical protein SAV31267_059700 [Streptomyces avermitilis]
MERPFHGLARQLAPPGQQIGLPYEGGGAERVQRVEGLRGRQRGRRGGIFRVREDLVGGGHGGEGGTHRYAYRLFLTEGRLGGRPHGGGSVSGAAGTGAAGFGSTGSAAGG